MRGLATRVYWSRELGLPIGEHLHLSGRFNHRLRCKSTSGLEQSTSNKISNRIGRSSHMAQYQHSPRSMWWLTKIIKSTCNRMTSNLGLTELKRVKPFVSSLYCKMQQMNSLGVITFRQMLWTWLRKRVPCSKPVKASLIQGLTRYSQLAPSSQASYRGTTNWSSTHSKITMTYPWAEVQKEVQSGLARLPSRKKNETLRQVSTKKENVWKK